MNYAGKSTPEEIRARFDRDVDRFSDLNKGQEAVIDSTLCLDLVARAAAAASPHAGNLLDIGCGAGNYSVKLSQYRPGLHATLVDLSQPMLDRARARVLAAGAREVVTIQSDMRSADLGEARFDLILATAVLHHLRGDDEWRAVFASLYRCLKPGGSVWVYDLVEHESGAIHQVMWERYGQFLEGLGGPEYRQRVFDYIAEEDTPRPLTYQLELLRAVGFAQVDVLHKSGPFAAFGGVKAG